MSAGELFQAAVPGWKVVFYLGKGCYAMNFSESTRIVLKDGSIGTIESQLPAEAGSKERLKIRLQNGHAVLVPTDVLQLRPDGSYYLPVDQYFVNRKLVARSRAERGNYSTVAVVPVVAEELDVQKRVITTGGVRVTKQVQEREEVVDEPGYSEQVRVEHIPVNRPVDSVPPVRYEGNTMIIPLLEEEVVVQKRLILKEEIRVSKQRQEFRNPQHVTLRREEASVERFEPEEENKQDV